MLRFVNQAAEKDTGHIIGADGLPSIPTQKFKCTRCNGRKRILVPEGPKTANFKTIVCPLCKGKGHVKNLLG